MSYLYGPVYSRRLGFSLGVDPFSRKVCSFNCVYCQLGPTLKRTIVRRGGINLERVREELENILKNKVKINYITISGSGEPTLLKNLDKLIRLVGKTCKHKYPICVITNSSLLYRKDVRNQLKETNLVIPSLDAPNQEIFQKINRPHSLITLDKVVKGLIEFRKEYKGKIWLEIMLVKGINDKEEFAYQFKKKIYKINPDRVQINTPIRAIPYLRKSLLPSPKVIYQFKKILGRNCQVVNFRKVKVRKVKTFIDKNLVFASLKRRPQSIEELSISLGVELGAIEKCVRSLIKDEKLREVVEENRRYLVIK
ncbi:MAG: radical SAM protein [Candidatus Omnitrophota bacterium]|mgnify:CR=1 FL=1|nr:MAG: radical SAM protein [Candidatus Omnitrophota bacterium]HDN86429.1 radical SAM protein [Candidatus Omnitrophota bacterium]